MRRNCCGGVCCLSRELHPCANYVSSLSLSWNARQHEELLSIITTCDNK